MLNRMAAALFAVALVSLPGVASAATVTSAQDLADTPFAAFLGSEDYRRAQALAIAQVDHAEGALCEEGYQVQLLNLAVQVPVVMDDGDARPTAGRWIERFQATRCGTTSLFNTIAQVNEEGRLSVTPVAPGETSQNFSMVIDLLPVLLPKAEIPDCQQRILKNTRLGVPAGYEKKQPDGKYETWTVKGCDKTVDMVLLFTPAENGGTNIGIEGQFPVYAN